MFRSICSSISSIVVDKVLHKIWLNGHHVNIQAMARKAAKVAADFPGCDLRKINCTGRFNGDSLDASSIVVWYKSDTHGTWCCHKATQRVKDILCLKYGAHIPWYKR